jgi:uncharacterized protein (DUF1800 family)
MTKKMLLQNCAITSIAPQQSFFGNRHLVMHLYRRLGFGASEADIQAGLSLSPSQLVDQLLDTAAGLPSPVAPYWSNWNDDAYNSSSETRFEHYIQFRNRWLREMITEGIRAKLALFWHGHFVTQLDVYKCSAYLWRYYELLHVHAFGHFKTFVEEMGKTPAMLVYLNGDVNEAGEPNENYARELLELFTMGANNGYTAIDIINLARSLTGWKVDKYDCEIPTALNYIDPDEHDFDAKTLFGQTIPALTGTPTIAAAAAEYDTVHDIIFTQREDEIALYICEQLYQFFVYPEVNPAIVNAMAATFKNPNTKWQIMPVLKQLFKSEHFFDDTFVGGHIKSPMELFAGMARAADLQYPQHYDEGDLRDWVKYAEDLGQWLFEPPNVSGWDGYRSWVNENTLTNRWGRANEFIYELSETARIHIRDMVSAGVGPANQNNPEEIVSFVVNIFINRPLEAEHQEVAIQYLKAGIPQNYFDDGSWNLGWDSAPDQIINLLGYLTRLPEFQMN